MGARRGAWVRERGLWGPEQRLAWRGAGGAGIVGLHRLARTQRPVFEERIEIASMCALGSEKNPRMQPGSPVVQAGFYLELLVQEAFSPASLGHAVFVSPSQ